MAAEREGDGDEDRDGDGGGRKSVAALESMGHGERHILLLISSNIIYPCSSVSHPHPHPHPNGDEDREVVLSRHASIYLCLFSTSHHSLNFPPLMEHMYCTLESSIAFQEAVKEIEDKIREVERTSDTMTGRLTDPLSLYTSLCCLLSVLCLLHFFVSLSTCASDCIQCACMFATFLKLRATPNTESLKSALFQSISYPG